MLPGAPYALSATLPSCWATANERFGPIGLRIVDAHNNPLPGRTLAPKVELRAMAPLRANGAEAPTPAPPVCQLDEYTPDGQLWLRLCGSAARVTLVLSAAYQPPYEPAKVDRHRAAALELGLDGTGVATDSAHGSCAQQVQPAELLLHLTGGARALCVSVGSRGAVADQIYGPLRVTAVDDEGNAVGSHDDGGHFEPLVTVRRIDAGGNASGSAGSSAGSSSSDGIGGGRGSSDVPSDDVRVDVTVQKVVWQQVGASQCPIALVWLTLHGRSGEVHVEIADAKGRVARGARVPLYLTGPPYTLRVSNDVATSAAGDELGPILVRLVDSRGKQVCGLPFAPMVSLSQEPPAAATTTSAASGVGGSIFCELTRLEWQRTSGNAVAQAAALHVRLRGRVGDVTLWIHDTALYACAPVPLRLQLVAGPTVPQCCRVPCAECTASLVAGEWRYVIVQCADMYGNAAPAGCDRIEFAVHQLGGDGGRGGGAKLVACASSMEEGTKASGSVGGADAGRRTNPDSAMVSCGCMSTMPDAGEPPGTTLHLDEPPGAAAPEVRVEVLPGGAYRLAWRLTAAARYALSVRCNGVALFSTNKGACAVSKGSAEGPSLLPTAPPSLAMAQALALLNGLAPAAADVTPRGDGLHAMAALAPASTHPDMAAESLALVVTPAAPHALRVLLRGVGGAGVGGAASEVSEAALLLSGLPQPPSHVTHGPADATPMVEVEAGRRVTIQVQPVDAFGNAHTAPLALSTPFELRLTRHGDLSSEGDAVPLPELLPLGETWRPLPAAEGGGAMLRLAIGGGAGPIQLGVSASIPPSQPPSQPIQLGMSAMVSASIPTAPCRAPCSASAGRPALWDHLMDAAPSAKVDEPSAKVDEPSAKVDEPSASSATSSAAPSLIFIPADEPNLLLRGCAHLLLVPGRPHAPLCELEGDGVHGAVAGERARLRLWLRDAWGNQIGRTRTTAPDALTTAPQLLIELMSEEVLGGTTASPATVEVSKPRLQADGSYSMHYTVVRTGTCCVSVLLSTKHVRHSPSLVLVRAGAPVSLRLRAPSHSPICGEMYGPIAVWPVDAFGNAVLETPFEPLTLGAADGADKGADKGVDKGADKGTDKGADKGTDKGTEPPVAPAEIVRLEWNYVSTRGEVVAHDGARADAHDGAQVNTRGEVGDGGLASCARAHDGAQGGGGGGCGGTTHAMVATTE